MPYYRITVTFRAGHDMLSMVMNLQASNVSDAICAAIKALSQLGFSISDYEMTHSLQLTEPADWELTPQEMHQKDHGDTDKSMRVTTNN